MYFSVNRWILILTIRPIKTTYFVTHWMRIPTAISKWYFLFSTFTSNVRITTGTNKEINIISLFASFNKFETCFSFQFSNSLEQRCISFCRQSWTIQNALGDGPAFWFFQDLPTRVTLVNCTVISLRIFPVIRIRNEICSIRFHFIPYRNVVFNESMHSIWISWQNIAHSLFCNHEITNL